MKSMLSEVRLERPIHDGHVSTEAIIQELLEQEAMLKNALEAALAVIEAMYTFDDAESPEEIHEASHGLAVATDRLETALEPFRISREEDGK